MHRRLIEARDEAGTFFALDHHLELLASSDPQTPVDDIVTALIAHVPGELDDDVAVLLVQREDPIRRSQSDPGF